MLTRPRRFLVSIAYITIVSVAASSSRYAATSPEQTRSEPPGTSRRAARPTLPSACGPRPSPFAARCTGKARRPKASSAPCPVGRDRGCARPVRRAAAELDRRSSPRPTAWPALAPRERAPSAVGTTIGFAMRPRPASDAVELHVIAVLPEWHRRGVGDALVEHAEAYARDAGFDLLHVKTWRRATRPGLRSHAGLLPGRRGSFGRWRCCRRSRGPDDPCLLLVKSL